MFLGWPWVALEKRQDAIELVLVLRVESVSSFDVSNEDVFEDEGGLRCPYAGVRLFRFTGAVKLLAPIDSPDLAGKAAAGAGAEAVTLACERSVWAAVSAGR